MEQENKENVTTKELTAKAEAAEAKTQNEKEQVNETASPDLGKFKSVDALLQAYNSLQAEFTRRSQRLKELENSAAQANKSSTEAVPVTDNSAGKNSLDVAPMSEMSEEISLSEAQKQRVIEEYLSDIKRSSVPLMTAGVSVTSPSAKARTFAEAGKMALGYFKGNKQ